MASTQSTKIKMEDLKDRMETLSQMLEPEHVEDYPGERLAVLRIMAFADGALDRCNQWLNILPDWLRLSGLEDTVGLTESERAQKLKLKKGLMKYEVVAIANGKQAEDLLKSHSKIKENKNRAALSQSGSGSGPSQSGSGSGPLQSGSGSGTGGGAAAMGSNSN